MGKIKKLKETEFVGGTSNEDVYPITSVRAVYTDDNKSIDKYLVEDFTTQELGDASDKVISQKVVTSAIDNLDSIKFDKNDVVQELGNSPFLVVSQKALYKLFSIINIEKFDIENIVHDLGDGSTLVISQKGITDIVNTINQNKFNNPTILENEEEYEAMKEAGAIDHNVWYFIKES